MSLLIQTFISEGRIQSYLKDIRRFFFFVKVLFTDIKKVNNYVLGVCEYNKFNDM